MHTNLSLLDWAIVAVCIVALRLVSLSTRRYMRGVADFLSANRLAGRYLLTIASAMGNMGVISFIANFEAFCQAGFAAQWWGGFSIPFGIIMLMSGWVYYRFRETRALTMAQFLETRYSRNFRFTAGLFCWTSGVINFGIFPAVAAHFFIYFCGLPDHFRLPYPVLADGIQLAYTSWTMNTFATVMAIDLILALSFVTMGGQISIMITECVQGLVSAFFMLIVAGYIWMHIKWADVVVALSQVEAGKSMLNPFDTGKMTDFNIWFYLIGIVGGLYGYMSWQGGQGFFSSARTPHEQRMGNIIGGWRGLPQSLLTMMLPLAALVILRVPGNESMAHTINGAIDSIPNKVVGNSMMVPIAMAHFLPAGIKGLLAVIMLFFSFTCHDTYMHSWGSIFVQDVYLPVAQRLEGRRSALARLFARVFHIPASPEKHITVLRRSIVFVAAFSFVFSLLYQPTGAILFFFALTGTIWLGGSGIVIIGGLYSRWGTTAAAYTALILGAVFGIGGLVLDRYWDDWTGHKWFINGQWMYFFGMVLAAFSYLIVSFLTGGFKKAMNLDRILHRGQYVIESDQVHYEVKQSWWLRLVGITDEFSKVDKFLALYVICYSGLSFVWFIVFSIINLVMIPHGGVSDAVWAKYWHFTIYYIAVPAVPCTIWFTVGGIMDIKALFKALSSAKRDHSDDGRVRTEEEMEAMRTAALPVEPIVDLVAVQSDGQEGPVR